MAAPERFAEMSDSSCTAGAVHTWHFASELSPLSGAKRKSDFGAVKAAFDPQRTIIHFRVALVCKIVAGCFS